ncbi:MAG: acyl-CoA desaturase [Sphingobacteriales bacterium]|nr:MAG: acyl-CoA desaturase [Sphingobacteriales bacterium]
MKTAMPSKETLASFEKELETLRLETRAKLGKTDEQYIKRVILVQRLTEVSARALLQFGIFPPFWLVGTGLLGISKILDNMEIGHNVMHGQYDWMNDPTIHSSNFEWDTACDGHSWRRTHNYEHHTYTNILGKDRDYGYGVIRLDEDMPFRNEDYFNIFKLAMLQIFFQWGVAVHELEADKIRDKEISIKDKIPFLKQFAKKGFRQVFKDYMFFPALGLFTGSTIPILLGNATANLIRNLWASTVIFCGHFPEGSYTFSEEECENESKGQWYYRQILGSCNFEGGKIMHIMSGHLSYQVEHHLFPDIPSTRYPEMSKKVREICKKHNIPYNTAPLHEQYFSVIKKVLKHSVPSKNKVAVA